MNVFKSISLTKDFGSLEEADTWVDSILDEFDEFGEAFTSLKGNGLGVITATVEFNKEYETDAPSIVWKDSGEPDLFDPS